MDPTWWQMCLYMLSEADIFIQKGMKCKTAKLDLLMVISSLGVYFREGFQVCYLFTLKPSNGLLNWNPGIEFVIF